MSQNRAALQWGHEAISPARNIGDEPGAVLTIAERLTKGGDVEFEISLLYELFGPDTGKKLLLGDHHGRALEERGENDARPATEPNRLFALSGRRWSRTSRNDPKENSLGECVSAPVIVFFATRSRVRNLT